MNCMKCGREVEADQVFCAECRDEMKDYPVKPGVVVQLPVQPAAKQVHHRRPVQTAEEQIRKLHKRVHVLILALILTSAAAIFFALMAFDILEKYNVNALLGKNYSTVVDSSAATDK